MQVEKQLPEGKKMKRREKEFALNTEKEVTNEGTHTQYDGEGKRREGKWGIDLGRKANSSQKPRIFRRKAQEMRTWGNHRTLTGFHKQTMGRTLKQSVPKLDRSLCAR